MSQFEDQFSKKQEDLDVFVNESIHRRYYHKSLHNLCYFLDKIDPSLLNEMELFVNKHKQKHIFLRSRNQRIHIYEDILFISTTKRHQDLLSRKGDIEAIWKELSRMTGRSLITLIDRLTKRICRVSIEDIRSCMEKEKDIPLKKLVGLHSKASQPSNTKRQTSSHNKSKIRHLSIGDSRPKLMIRKLGADGIREINLSQVIQNSSQDYERSQSPTGQQSINYRIQARYLKKMLDVFEEPREQAPSASPYTQMFQVNKIVNNLKQNIARVEEQIKQDEQNHSSDSNSVNIFDYINQANYRSYYAYGTKQVNFPILIKVQFHLNDFFTWKILTMQQENQSKSQSYSKTIIEREEQHQKLCHLQVKLEDQINQDASQVYVKQEDVTDNQRYESLQNQSNKNKVKKEANIENKQHEQQFNEQNKNQVKLEDAIEDCLVNQSQYPVSQILLSHGQILANEEQELTSQLDSNLTISHSLVKLEPPIQCTPSDQKISNFIQSKINDKENDSWTQNEDKIIIKYAETQDSNIQDEFVLLIKQRSIKKVIQRIKHLQTKPNRTIMSFVQTLEQSLK